VSAFGHDYTLFAAGLYVGLWIAYFVGLLSKHGDDEAWV
jgi:hypothetical protein